jgi:hypothetical protein
MINYKGTNFVNKNIRILPLEDVNVLVPKEKVETLIKKLRRRAEFEMPDMGTFREIKEAITNDKALLELGNIELSINPTSALNSSAERTLDVALSTSSGKSKHMETLAMGSREEILKYLNDENFPENFKRFLIDCSDEFERKGME